MDLWPAYGREAKNQNLGKSRLVLKTGNRHHTSLVMVRDAAMELELNKAISVSFSESARYILAKQITYDMLISIYDVNKRNAIAMRITQQLTENATSKITAEIKKKGMKNIEIRIIGMQGIDPATQGAVDKIRTHVPGRLMELDLFGNEVRHIALDLKTGASYDLLTENRHYGPAELINNNSAGDFAQKRSELAFV